MNPTNTHALHHEASTTEAITVLINGSGLGLCLLIGFTLLTAYMIARG